jgi:hypothetical protein
MPLTVPSAVSCLSFRCSLACCSRDQIHKFVVAKKPDQVFVLARPPPQPDPYHVTGVEKEISAPCIFSAWILLVMAEV